MSKCPPFSHVFVGFFFFFLFPLCPPVPALPLPLDPIYPIYPFLTLPFLGFSVVLRSRRISYRHDAAATRPAPTQRGICSRTEHQDSSRALLSSQDRPLTAPAVGHPQLKASQGDAKMQGQYRRCSALATRTSRLTVPCIPEEYAIRLWRHDDRHFRHSIHADCPSSFKPFLSCHRQLSKT